jgi:hypothetical protein
MTERIDMERMSQNDIDIMRRRISFETHEVSALADRLEDFNELKASSHRVVTPNHLTAVKELVAILDGSGKYNLTTELADHVQKCIDDLHDLTVD